MHAAPELKTDKALRNEEYMDHSDNKELLRESAAPDIISEEASTASEIMRNTAVLETEEEPAKTETAAAEIETDAAEIKADTAEEDSEVSSGSDKMKNVAAVRFRTAGKVYYFDAGDFKVSRGSKVIVETVRGIEAGTVVSELMQLDEEKLNQPLKRVIRIATVEDVEQEALNHIKEREAFKVCQEKIRKHQLDMKLIDAEYTFDNSKVLFYFTADGRVDFRELVKDLAGVFRTRIELRQIGVRDETKILGGYGICGRPLCCHTYLSDFAPVSIKMAKEQNLSLNPTKISGVCGRLMCCLQNEEETYEELNRNLPKVGDEVQGSDGLVGEVFSVNVLRQLVKICVDVDDEKELHEYPADEITLIRKKKRGTGHTAKKERNTSGDNAGERGKENSKRSEKHANRDKEHSREGVKDGGRDNGKERTGDSGSESGKANRNGRGDRRRGRHNRGGRNEKTE